MSLEPPEAGPFVRAIRDLEVALGRRAAGHSDLSTALRIDPASGQNQCTATDVPHK
jgi:hypothetical protein